jgi:hypothetical protein
MAQGPDSPDARTRRGIRITQAHEKHARPKATLPQQAPCAPLSAPKAGQAHGFSCKPLILLKKVLLKIQSF